MLNKYFLEKINRDNVHMTLQIYSFAKCQRCNVRYREHVSRLMLNCIEIPFHHISVSFDGRNWGFIMEIIGKQWIGKLNIGTSSYPNWFI